MNDCLKAIGVKHLFDENSNSLPKIGGFEPTHVRSIKQKLSLKLNEKGTKIVASVQQLDQTESFVQGPFMMHVNRPFLLAVEDERTKEWLFLGAIFNPHDSKGLSEQDILRRDVK
jgi:serpin B